MPTLQTTPDTFDMMLLGYIIIFGIGIIYIASMALRWRALKRLLETLEESADTGEGE